MRTAKTLITQALVVLACMAYGEGSARVKVACIGDSITYGLGLANRETEAYPARLQAILDAVAAGKIRDTEIVGGLLHDASDRVRDLLLPEQ